MGNKTNKQKAIDIIEDFKVDLENIRYTSDNSFLINYYTRGYYMFKLYIFFRKYKTIIKLFEDHGMKESYRKVAENLI